MCMLINVTNISKGKKKIFMTLLKKQPFEKLCIFAIESYCREIKAGESIFPSLEYCNTFRVILDEWECLGEAQSYIQLVPRSQK